MSGKPVGLRLCRIGAPKVQLRGLCMAHNTELGLPTGPPGAGWAMYFLELLHFYLDETNAMRSTSVPEYLFLLSRRKSYSTGREGPCWTEWNFIKKTAGISFCNE